MRILVMLVAILVFTVAGFFVGGSMVTIPPNATISYTGPRDPDREMQQSLKNFSAGAEVMHERTQRGMIGAGIGLLLGLAAGAVAASKFGPKKQA